MGRNNEIWHKDAPRGGEFKFMGSRATSDVMTISGRGVFFIHMFACKDENIDYFNLQVHCMSQTTRKTTRRQEELDSPGFRGGYL